MKETIAVFDVGKTNKKIFLFDKQLNIIESNEEKFENVTDEDGFECDDIEKIEQWVASSLDQLAGNDNYDLKAVNFTTYGASLVYLDERGKRLAPVYNYLKPLPEGFFDTFYERYGGIEEFSRITASPAMGMLNSGLQILWLKRTRPEVFRRVRHILHFPNYLSYLLTGKCLSEYTSIGCHTAMWDFDNMKYHPWLKDEGIDLEKPVPNDLLREISINNRKLEAGTGIHDSSSSLVPYFSGISENFILISTGTWCINMNPFNHEPLTREQLRSDCLAYLSINQKPVKSSRLFMGHIHDVNLGRINEHFGIKDDRYKRISPDSGLMAGRLSSGQGNRRFFRNPESGRYLDDSVDLSSFSSYQEAYHHMVFDLTELCIESINLIIPEPRRIQNFYVTGGFARNNIFMSYLSSRLSGDNVYTSEVDNATALGAALILWRKVEKADRSLPDLGLISW